MKGKKTGGRVKYEGDCCLCGAVEARRWYRRYHSEGTVCNVCYQRERQRDPVIREKRLAQRKEWGQKNPYKSAMNQAKFKKMEFNLTEEEFLNKTIECFYCGDDLSKISEGIKLDRIDSNLHYTSENTVGCCRMCNVAKNNHTQEEFYSWIRRLKEKLP